MCIFLLGGFVGLGLAMARVGGQAGMFRTLDNAGHPYMKHMLREANDRSTPWPGLFFGQLVSASWCVPLTLYPPKLVLSFTTVNLFVNKPHMYMYMYTSQVLVPRPGDGATGPLCTRPHGGATRGGGGRYPQDPARVYDRPTGNGGTDAVRGV